MIDANTRDERWQRFLGDMERFAATAQPLETTGSLVRVTGLVLEAAGVRVPVGSVCDVWVPGQKPVGAEVVDDPGEAGEVVTQREREVLALVGQGLSNQEIAARLVLSPATARTHVSRTMVKLRARDRA